MFIYLFLIAAIAASSELPSTDTETQELQELITIFTQEEPAEIEQVNPVEITEQIEQPIEASTVAKAAQSITITNAIESSMLAYKHWTGTYSPDTFTIYINGVEVAQGAQYTLSAEASTIDIKYFYSFMNGMRTGTKTVSYQLHENITHANITFSWKDNWKVLVDNGTALKEVIV